MFKKFFRSVKSKLFGESKKTEPPQIQRHGIPEIEKEKTRKKKRRGKGQMVRILDGLKHFNQGKNSSKKYWKSIRKTMTWEQFRQFKRHLARVNDRQKRHLPLTCACHRVA
jgi:hypothetical protein